ncbi:MAG: sulfatase-like hydrolase/transferase [Candidatus Eisenbacteria bacterium]
MWYRFLLLAGVAAKVFCCAAPANGSETEVLARNVILIVSDALRPDVLGAYGGEARTPYIDSLAGDGVTFLNAFSTSSWTGPASVSPKFPAEIP